MRGRDVGSFVTPYRRRTQAGLKANDYRPSQSELWQQRRGALLASCPPRNTPNQQDNRERDEAVGHVQLDLKCVDRFGLLQRRAL
jgi:hypothetical protein